MSESNIININNHVGFVKSISIGDNQDITIHGSLRYNQSNNTFEGLHKSANADYLGNTWRPLTSNIASSSEAGIFRVGTNLLMNSTTGVLSSVATGNSRIYQQVITVSDNVGAADYQSIQTAINHAIGSADDGYTTGAITASNGAPSLVNQYIILVSPGTYTEKINVPNYVSIVGEGRNRTFIKLSEGGSSVALGALMTLASTSSVENLTLELNANSEDYVTGIYSSSNSNIAVRNVDVVDTTSGAGTAAYGLYLSGGTGHIIDGFTGTLDLGTGSVYGMYISDATPPISESTLTITSGSTNNYGIYINSANGGDITTSKCEINSGNNNYGIYLNNSDANIRNCKLVADGDTNNDTDTAYGIALNSSTSYASITSTELEFISNYGSNDGTGQDVIHLTSTSTNNFVTDGYVVGKTIKVTGASTSANNNYFTISKITTDTLTLSKGDTLTTEAAGQSVTIKQLYTTNVEYSHLEATSNGSAVSNSVAVISSSGNHQVNFRSNDFVGSVPDANSSSFSFNIPQVINVAKRGGDYDSLSEAMSSIVDNDTTKRYVIKIAPGNYTERSGTQITGKSYVSVIGSGCKNTIINFDKANASLASGMSAIVLESNSEFADLTIKNTTSSATTYSSCFYGLAKDDINIHNCDIVVSGTARYLYGIYIDDCVIDTYSNEYLITAPGDGIEAYGIYQKDSTTSLNTANVVVSGGSSTHNIAIYNIDTNSIIQNPKINVSGGDSKNEGISCLSNTVNDYLIQVDGGEVVAGGTGNKSLNVEDDNYMIVAKGSRLEGTVSFTETNTDNVIRCIGCYQVGTSSELTYAPLNHRGENDSASGNMTIGEGSGKSGATGENNIIIGIDSGQAITSGDRNTIVGTDSGQALTDGEDNTLVGFSSGQAIVGADYNTAIGSNSAIRITTGSNNTMVGRNAGFDLTTGGYNTVIGESAGYKMTTGASNLLGGQGAGFNSTTGARNVMLGGGSASNVGAGYSTTTASDSVYVGYQAGQAATTGGQSVMVGSQAGYNNTAANNVLIGYRSGYTNTSGTGNTFTGNSAGYLNETGSRNSVYGDRAGYSMTTGSGNTLLGHESGYNLTTGARNVIIGGTDTADTGSSAGYLLTTGSDTVIIGSGAGQVSTASNNIYIGSNAAASITSGLNNVAIGKDALANNVVGKETIAIGFEAAKGYVGSASVPGNLVIGVGAGYNTQSNSSTFLGSYSGYNLQGGRNTFVGYKAGYGKDIESYGRDNIGFGAYVGYNIKGGNRNIILGGGDSTTDSTGVSLEGGSDNILMGYKAGKSIINSDNNILIGGEAGYSVSSGISNFGVGYQSLRTETTGDYNIAMGYQSLYNQNTVDKNIAIGYQAAYTNTSGTDIISIGIEAGYAGSTAIENINIGSESGRNTTASGNINLGQRAGYGNVAGSKNLFAGYKSGGGGDSGSTATTAAAKFNVGIGNKTLFNLTQGARNICAGNSAGFYMTTGGKNVLVGNLAGHGVTTGVGNIYMGSAPSDTVSGVGYNASDGNRNIGIGSNTAVSLTSGDDNLTLGSDSAQSLTTGHRNVIAGYRAGRSLTSADDNVLLGPSAGLGLTTGSDNVIVGRDAGLNSGGAQTDNVIIGTESGQDIQTDNLVFIGYRSGYDHTTGTNCVFVGANAGKANTTANQNTFIGANAGEDNTGSRNTFVGTDAGKNNTSGVENIFVGYAAGEDNTTGSYDIAIGNNAYNNGSGSNVVIIGFEAGSAAGGNSADDIILIGSQAGSNVTTGGQSIMIGRQAGLYTTTGEGNLLIGAESGLYNTKGKYNIGIGHQSLRNFDNHKTSGDGGFNIAIGYQTGKNLGDNSALGAYQSSFQNTILGYQALLNGDTSNNNVIIGSQTAMNVDNKRLFANNVLVGTEAGKTSNLAVDSVTIGPNANKEGSGGKFNLIFGKETGNVVGVNESGATTFAFAATAGDLCIATNMPFGTATYYFGVGDKVILDSNSTNNYEELLIASITSNASTPGSDIHFSTVLAKSYSSGDNIYLIPNKSDAIGDEDTSRASSNTLMGTQVGTAMTTASKNIGIGDNAMKTNVIGKYNNVIGPDAGYSLVTDHNTCIGTKAGYSIDTFEIASTTSNNLVFYGTNNVVKSDVTNLSGYDYGAVIEISGSSGNDGRFRVVSSNATSIRFDGYPKIEEDGVPSTVAGDALIIADNRFTFYNDSVTSSTISFGYDELSASTSTPYGTISTSTASEFTTINTLGETSNIALKMIEISGSAFNDGIYPIYTRTEDDSLYGTNLKTYGNYTVLVDGVETITITDYSRSDIMQSDETHEIFFYEERKGNSVTINARCIIPKNISVASSTTFKDVKPNHLIFSYFGNNRGTYRHTNYNDVLYSDTVIYHGFYLNNNNYNVVTDEYATIFMETQKLEETGENNSTAFSEKLYNINNGRIKIQNDYENSFKSHCSVSFHASNNVIKFEDDVVRDHYVSIRTNVLFNVSNTSLNNGYYLADSVKKYGTNGVKYVINDDYTLVDETVSFGCKFLFTTMKGFSNISNIVDTNDVINVYNESYFGDHNQGAYYAGGVSSSQLALSQNIFVPTLKEKGENIYTTAKDKHYVNRDLYNLTTTSNLIEGDDIIFQNDSVTIPVTFSVNDGNDMSSTNHSTIIVEKDYTFRNMLAPCVIKISSSSNNNKYFYVKRNVYPYNTLELDPSTPLTAEGGNPTVQIQTNSISSVYRHSSFSGFSVGQTLRTLGSIYNNDLQLVVASTYNSVTPIYENSMYLSTTVVTENGDNNGLFVSLSRDSSDVFISPVNDDAANYTSTRNVENMRDIYWSGYFNRLHFKEESSGGDYPDAYSGSSISGHSSAIYCEIIPTSGMNSYFEIDIYATAPDLSYLATSNSNGLFNRLKNKSYVIIEGSASATTNGCYIISRGVSDVSSSTANSSATEKITIQLEGSNSSVITLRENTTDNSSLLIGINEFKFIINSEASDGKVANATHLDYHFGKNADFLGFRRVAGSKNSIRNTKSLNYKTSFYKRSADGAWPNYSNIGICNSKIPVDHYFLPTANNPEPQNYYLVELGAVTSNTSGQIEKPHGLLSTVSGLLGKSISLTTSNFTSLGFTTIPTYGVSNAYVTGNMQFSTGNGVIKLKNISVEELGGLKVNESYRSINGYKYLITEKPFGGIIEGMSITVASISSANNSQNDGNYVVKTVYSNGMAIQVDKEYRNLQNDNTMNFSSSNQLEIYPQKGITSNRFDFSQCRVEDFSTQADPDQEKIYNSNVVLYIHNKDTDVMKRTSSVDSTNHSYDTTLIKNLFTLSKENFHFSNSSYTSNSSHMAATNYSPLTVDLFPNRFGKMNHTLIFPEADATSRNTNISFKKQEASGTLSFATNQITSSTVDLSVFSANSTINVAGSDSNDGMYQIFGTPTTTTIVVNASLTSETDTASVALKSNCILSSDISSANLAVYHPGQSLSVFNTVNNNTSSAGYTLASNVVSNAYSIYVTGDVITETPKFARLVKNVINTESNVAVGTSNLKFYSGNGAIVTENGNTLLDIFRPGQSIKVLPPGGGSLGSGNSGDFTISSEPALAPTKDTLIVNSLGTIQTSQSARIEKNVILKTIGKPLVNSTASVTLSTTGALSHYQDAQGNNLMLGSFTGQYAGALSQCLHNTYIGNKVGQTNHGSGNIFLGSETDLATTATDGSTTYDNKLAIYKSNFIGIPSKPLIGGDFNSGRVGINTITPENTVSTSDITETAIKFVVNGGAYANSFSPFTGTHIINLAPYELSNSIKPGMILSSTGKVNKQENTILNTYITTTLSSKPNDKTVYGVYSHSDTSVVSGEPEYKLDRNTGKIVKNSLYSTKTILQHYCASVGEGQILVTDINGEVNNGDYITTSSIPGYGQLQEDDALHSYTVAKCTQYVDWGDPDGKKYKTMLVSCTYHCG